MKFYCTICLVHLFVLCICFFSALFKRLVAIHVLLNYGKAQFRTPWWTLHIKLVTEYCFNALLPLNASMDSILSKRESTGCVGCMCQTGRGKRPKVSWCQARNCTIFTPVHSGPNYARLPLVAPHFQCLVLFTERQNFWWLREVFLCRTVAVKIIALQKSATPHPPLASMFAHCSALVDLTAKSA